MILSTSNRLSSISWPPTPTTFWFLFSRSISPLFSPQLAHFTSTILFMFVILPVSCTNTSLVYLLHLISSHRFAIYFILSLSAPHVLHLLLSSSVKCLFTSVYFPLWIWLLIFRPLFSFSSYVWWIYVQSYVFVVLLIIWLLYPPLLSLSSSLLLYTIAAIYLFLYIAMLSSKQIILFPFPLVSLALSFSFSISFTHSTSNFLLDILLASFWYFIALLSITVFNSFDFVSCLIIYFGAVLFTPRIRFKFPSLYLIHSSLPYPQISAPYNGSHAPYQQAEHLVNRFPKLATVHSVAWERSVQWNNTMCEPLEYVTNTLQYFWILWNEHFDFATFHVDWIVLLRLQQSFLHAGVTYLSNVVQPQEFHRIK